MRTSATSPPRSRTASAQAWQTAACFPGQPGEALEDLHVPVVAGRQVGERDRGLPPRRSTVTAWNPGWRAWRASANSRQPVSGQASSPATPQTTKAAR